MKDSKAKVMEEHRKPKPELQVVIESKGRTQHLTMSPKWKAPHAFHTSRRVNGLSSWQCVPRRRASRVLVGVRTRIQVALGGPLNCVTS